MKSALNSKTGRKRAKLAAGHSQKAGRQTSGSRLVGAVLITMGLLGAVALSRAVMGHAAKANAEASATRMLPGRPTLARAPATRAVGQGSSASPVNLNLLSLQAAPDRLRRLLGSRFTNAGREITTLTGVMTISGVQQPVQVVRTQSNSGESVTINYGGDTLSWTPSLGAISGVPGSSSSSPVTDPNRSTMERLALDSADGFIAGQLRSASYYTVARDAAPPGMSDDYTGPSWDLVRVGEPNDGSHAQAESPARLYYINTVTGLIDMVVSQEGGQTVTANLTGWTAVDGETMPTQITWQINGQTVMTLSVSGYSYAPAQ